MAETPLQTRREQPARAQPFQKGGQPRQPAKDQKTARPGLRASRRRSKPPMSSGGCDRWRRANTRARTGAVPAAPAVNFL
jgi:hypothetical protein